MRSDHAGSGPAELIFDVPTVVVGESSFCVPCKENERMADPIDLPPNVQTNLLTAAVNAHQSAMTVAEQGFVTANNILNKAAVRNFDELGTSESKAIETVSKTA